MFRIFLAGFSKIIAPGVGLSTIFLSPGVGVSHFLCAGGGGGGGEFALSKTFPGGLPGGVVRLRIH